jgi:nitrite reductase (NO-forming)
MMITSTIAVVAIALSGWNIISGSGLTNKVSTLTDNVGQLSKTVNPNQTFAPAKTTAVDIRHDAADLPAPIRRTVAEKVVLNLETVEVDGKLADGTTYTYWTFNKTVPGPMLRVREGDTVELHLKNNPNSKSIHSIDLHAVNGPGGGASVMQVKPGEEKVFTFKATNPGVYAYHCASPHIPTHIAEGMYGLIVVEPKAGLAPVDKEFYVMQGEIYSNGMPGQKGHQDFDGGKLRNEQPDFVVFNGAFQALTGDKAMHAKVGDRVRIFVGNGGPNLVSSFHLIGEIFDQVHDQGATEAMSNVQTTVIPAGGAAWVEFKLDEPGRYSLVDHAISRAIDKGAVAFIDVDGQPDPAIYSTTDPFPMPGMGGH